MEILQAIKHINDPTVTVKINQALRLLKRTLELYPPSRISFSFNGGKDSTVLLHLLRAAVAHHQQAAHGAHVHANGCVSSSELGHGSNVIDLSGQHSTTVVGTRTEDANGAGPCSAAPTSCASGLPGVRCFFFEQTNDFDEVKSFVHSADRQYHLGVEYLRDNDFREGLSAYLKRTKVAAVLLGTRKGDPNAGDQEHFSPSSDGWPPFMRVNPLLDWTFHDVWAFLRATHVKYCRLYDEGYTSLGSRHNTQPNTALRKGDGSFSPAYTLMDSKLERAGRSTGQERASSSSLPCTSPPPYTAGIVVVGNELLTGRVDDLNTPFLCQQLHEMGWRVVKVAVVPDNVEMIGEELRRLSEAVEVVITSGGVGPTPDDVTMAGVAHALGEPLIRNPEFQGRLERHFAPAPLSAAHLKMAETPGGGITRLLDYRDDRGDVSNFPLVCCRNIYVLPGVPQLLRLKWRVVRSLLEQQAPAAQPYHNRVLRLSLSDETQLADALERAASEHVTLGSYPVTGQADGAQLLVTLDSKDSAALQAAADAFRQLIPHDCVIAEQSNVSQLSPRPSIV